jgi:hypothetical protein
MTNRRSGRKTFMIGAVAFVLGAGAMWAQQQATTRREPQFDNTRLKVWKSIIYPNQPLSLHRHDHGRSLMAYSMSSIPRGSGSISTTGRQGRPTGSTKIRPTPPTPT